MSDKWYRGEGLSVEPAKAGAVDNDIGDGMYLTDQLEVAKQVEWYERQIEFSPSAEDSQRLSADRDKLIAQLNASLAD